MQHRRVITTTLTLALLATAASAQAPPEAGQRNLPPEAGQRNLLPTGAADLSSETLTAAPQLKGMSVPKEAVALSWPLAADAALTAAEPHVSSSKEYFVDVTAEDLGKGVPIYTTRPGALVRLNPAAGVKAGIDEKLATLPASLVLIDTAGKSWSAGSGMDLMVGPEQLKAAGAPFVEGTSAFRIREDLGAGAFTLRADGLTGSSERYVMHVFDRASPIALELTTGASDYLHGQTLTVEAALSAGTRNLRAQRIEGFVTSPAGRAWPLRFRNAGKGRYRASLTLDALEMPAPGLWQVHVSADGRAGGQTVLRAGRTAFACAVPSAGFSGEAQVDRASGLGFQLGVDAASAGRYEARGVLYATAADGALRPAGVAHSAAWLEAGAGSLELTFDPPLLAEGGLGAPYELRDLRLVNQATMGLLHRQERALAVSK